MEAGGALALLSLCMCAYVRACPTAPSPDVVVFLDVNLVKHHVFLLDVDISLHLHGNMPRQHRQQQALLTDRQTDRRRGRETRCREKLGKGSRWSEVARGPHSFPSLSPINERRVSQRTSLVLSVGER